MLHSKLSLYSLQAASNQNFLRIMPKAAPAYLCDVWLEDNNKIKV